MNDKDIKKLGYNPGEVNRGAVTWCVLFGVCLLVFFTTDNPYLVLGYSGVSVVLLALIYMYSVRKKKKSPAKSSLLFFLSEFGGGF